jgi:fibronectin type 3 domain-containing protein
VESTCTSFGLTEGSHCLVCNTVITAQKEIAKKAHTIVTDKAVAATCTTDGLTEGSHCSVCNYTFVYQTVIPATGHSYTTKKVAATTTSTGYTLYTCSVCGYSYKGNVTPKLSSGISLTKPSVTLANSTSGVKVTWSKVSGANGYIVYRKTPGGKFAVLKRITNSSTTTYTDTTAKAGTTYYYTVKAYSGSKYSSYETNQKIKYIKQPTVTLTNQSKGVKVTWTRTVGASGYYIYRKTANGKFVKIKTITSGSTVTFTDTTAKAGTTYYYTVKAYGKSGSKTYTSSYVANKTIKRLTQPSVTLTKVSNGIKITWSKITGASGYYVYRKTANGKFTKIKTITSGSTVYFTDKTAKSGTTYYYTVRAYSGNSLSSYVTNKSIKYKK